MSTQYKARIESNLVTTAVRCFMGWGDFFRSVINEMETVTGLILYQTGAKKWREGPGLLHICLGCSLRGGACCKPNPAPGKAVGACWHKALPGQRGFPELWGTTCLGSASSSCLENIITAAHIPGGWGQLPSGLSAIMARMWCSEGTSAAPLVFPTWWQIFLMVVWNARLC